MLPGDFKQLSSDWQLQNSGIVSNYYLLIILISIPISVKFPSFWHAEAFDFQNTKLMGSENWNTHNSFVPIICFLGLKVNFVWTWYSNNSDVTIWIVFFPLFSHSISCKSFWNPSKDRLKFRLDSNLLS